MISYERDARINGIAFIFASRPGLGRWCRAESSRCCQSSSSYCRKEGFEGGAIVEEGSEEAVERGEGWRHFFEVGGKGGRWLRGLRESFWDGGEV